MCANCCAQGLSARLLRFRRSCVRRRPPAPPAPRAARQPGGQPPGFAQRRPPVWPPCPPHEHTRASTPDSEASTYAAAACSGSSSSAAPGPAAAAAAATHGADAASCNAHQPLVEALQCQPLHRCRHVINQAAEKRMQLLQRLKLPPTQPLRAAAASAGPAAAAGAGLRQHAEQRGCVQARHARSRAGRARHAASSL